MLAALDVKASDDDTRADTGRPALAAGLRAAGLRTRPVGRPELLAATNTCGATAAKNDSWQERRQKG